MANHTSKLVSVIIPVFNGADFLSTCINSVLAQTYSEFEIILVDDGSTDSTAALADTYANQRPNIKVVHTPNQGLANARNLGLEHASGGYISFLDVDDEWAPEFLATALNKLASDQYVCFYSRVWNKKNTQLKPSYYPAHEGDLFRFLVTSNFIILSASVIKRFVFDDLGLRFKNNIYGHEDWDLVIEIASRGFLFCSSAKPLAIKTWHGANMSYEKKMLQSRGVVKRNAERLWAEFRQRAFLSLNPKEIFRYIYTSARWCLFGPRQLIHRWLHLAKVFLINMLGLFSSHAKR